MVMGAVLVMLNIRPATTDDGDAIWTILEPVLRAGETCCIPRDIDQTEALNYWFAKDNLVFIAEEHKHVVGTYYLRANQPGGGSHVANCGYMTASHASGRGIARAMCLHSKEQARNIGFRAIQFNFVIGTNERAIRLWQSLGFEVVGRLPLAYNHPTKGFTDALIMFS